MSKKVGVDRLVAAYHATVTEKRFTCSHLNVDLVAIPVTRDHEVTAESVRHRFTQGLESSASINDDIQANLVYETALVEQCILCDGEPIGPFAQKLPTGIVSGYYNLVKDVTAQFNPKIETWTDDEYRVFVSKFKKKGGVEIERLFAVLDGDMLRSFSLTTVLQHIRSPT